MNEVFDFLTETRTFYLATIDGDQARVRPFGAIAKFEDKLYFVTNNTKDVFKQLTVNPKVEVSAASSKGEWIRITGNAVVDSRLEAKTAMLEANPMLKKMYSAEDGVIEVFYLTDAVAVFNSFGSTEPKTVKF